MMLRIFTYIVVSIVVVSCGSTTDKRAELNELKKQRESITEKIQNIEKELKLESGKQVEIATTVSIMRFTGEIFKHFIEVQGIIESDNNILIPIQSPGIVKKIYVSEGQSVKKGDVLAQIDSDLIKKGIEELKISLNLATTVYERQERLWSKKIGSEVQYLQAKTQKESLEKKLQSLNKQLEMTKIISPINATVDKIIIREGEMAGVGKGAIRVVNLSDLRIKASLSESFINDVSKGDIVNVKVPSIGKNDSQKVLSVAKVINPSNRTFEIEVKAPCFKEIKPNMLTVLSINDYTKEDAIVVPINILQNTGTEFFVFKVVEKDGKYYAKKEFVKPGKYYNNMIEILEGVSSGESLVTFGFQQISDGSLLTISK